MGKRISKSIEILKPFPNEHACRLENPSQFTSFARMNCNQKHNGKCIDVIFGVKNGKSKIQALRYKKRMWTASQAKAHCDTRGGSFEAASKSMNKVLKASSIKDPNKYVWLKVVEDNFNITDKNIELKVLDSKEGVAYYHDKEDENKVYIWRFARSKGWNDENASLYIVTHKPTKKRLEEGIKYINEYDGKEALDKSYRQGIYNELVKAYYKLGIEPPKFNRQFTYLSKFKMKDKMKKLAELHNVEFEEFIDSAKKQRLDIVKSAVMDKTKEDGFAFFGNVEVFKKLTKDENGQETERWMIRSRFTSNKADLYNDVTSKNAIISGIRELNKSKSVLPIRFQHEDDDYGVWEKFYTEEKKGVLYGIAEGEFDKTLNRAQDLWKEMYDYGKKFATSYGGRALNWEWVEDEKSGMVVRILKGVKFREISLTHRPANPDTTTAIEALNKYAEKLENGIDFDQNISNFKDVAMKVKLQKSKNPLNNEDVSKKKEADLHKEDEEETTTETEEVEQPESQKEEENQETEETTEEETEEETETEDEKEGEEETEETDEEETEEEEAEEEKKSLKKADSKVLDAIELLTKKITDLESTVDAIKKQPKDRKSVIKVKGKETETTKAVAKEQEEFAKRYPYISNVLQGAAQFQKPSE